MTFLTQFRFSVVALALLLGVALSAAAVPSTNAQSSDLSVIRNRDRHQVTSPEVLAALERVFSRMHFEGLSELKVEAMLGTPNLVSKQTGNFLYHYPIWRDCGQAGPTRLFSVDPTTQMVVSVKKDES